MSDGWEDRGGVSWGPERKEKAEKKDEKVGREKGKERMIQQQG